MRLIHFFIFGNFFEFFLIIFLIFFVFFDFLLSPAPPSVGLIKRTFRGGLGGSGGVWRLWERSGRIYFGGFGPPPAPCRGKPPTSTRMPRARPAPSLRRSAAGLARAMRAELGRGRVGGGVTRVRATGAHAGVKRKQRVCNGSNAYA